MNSKAWPRRNSSPPKVLQAPTSVPQPWESAWKWRSKQPVTQEQTQGTIESQESALSGLCVNRTIAARCAIVGVGITRRRFQTWTHPPQNLWAPSSLAAAPCCSDTKKLKYAAGDLLLASGSSKTDNSSPA